MRAVALKVAYASYGSSEANAEALLETANEFLRWVLRPGNSDQPVGSETQRFAFFDAGRLRVFGDL